MSLSSPADKCVQAAAKMTESMRRAAQMTTCTTFAYRNQEAQPASTAIVAIDKHRDWIWGRAGDAAVLH